MLLKHFIASAILACAGITAHSIPVYSSILTEQRSGFCKKVAATADTVAAEGLSKQAFHNILSNTTSLSSFDKTTLWDALWRAQITHSSWWAYEFCMDRLET